MNEWWTMAQSNQIGGIAGAALGVLGGVLGSACGILTPRGKGTVSITTGFLVLVLIGAASLIAGLVAWLSGQPAHIIFPLCMIAGMLLLSTGPLTFTLPRLDAIAQARRMQAEELGRRFNPR